MIGITCLWIHRFTNTVLGDGKPGQMVKSRGWDNLIEACLVRRFLLLRIFLRKSDILVPNPILFTFLIIIFWRLFNFFSHFYYFFLLLNNRFFAYIRLIIQQKRCILYFPIYSDKLFDFGWSCQKIIFCFIKNKAIYQNRSNFIKDLAVYYKHIL